MSLFILKVISYSMAWTGL